MRLPLIPLLSESVYEGFTNVFDFGMFLKIGYLASAMFHILIFAQFITLLLSTSLLLIITNGPFVSINRTSVLF